MLGDLDVHLDSFSPGEKPWAPGALLGQWSGGLVGRWQSECGSSSYPSDVVFLGLYSPEGCFNLTPVFGDFQSGILSTDGWSSCEGY